MLDFHACFKADHELLDRFLKETTCHKKLNLVMFGVNLCKLGEI